jgi:hypothetical protein
MQEGSDARDESEVCAKALITRTSVPHSHSPRRTADSSLPTDLFLSFLALTRSSFPPSHHLEFACLRAGRSCSVHWLACWLLKHPARYLDRRLSLVCLPHSIIAIMPHALEPPAHLRALPRLAPRPATPPSLSSLAHAINQPLLEQDNEAGTMEQKIAEMKPSKRYAHSPHTLPSAGQASHDVKQMGISPRKSCGEKTTLDVRLLIHWLDHGLRTWCRTSHPDAKLTLAPVISTPSSWTT